jgi:hypothetical protein
MKYTISAPEVVKIALTKVKSRIMIPISGELLRSAKVDVLSDIVADDIVVAMVDLYAPASKREVKADVWVCEVPDGRWQMFKAALGLPYQTRDIYGPSTTIYSVCPHLDIESRSSHFEWLSDGYSGEGKNVKGCDEVVGDD